MSKLKVYVVHDSKVQAYNQPIFCRTAGEALRMWAEVSNDGKSMMSRYPADYTLFEVAEYDDSSGRFKQHDAHINLGTALDAKIPASEPTPMFSRQPQVTEAAPAATTG